MPDAALPPHFWIDLDTLKGHLEAAQASIRALESAALSLDGRATFAALRALRAELIRAEGLIWRNTPTY